MERLTSIDHEVLSVFKEERVEKEVSFAFILATNFF
jgi:hypothetical protein